MRKGDFSKSCRRGITWRLGFGGRGGALFLFCSVFSLSPATAQESGSIIGRVVTAGGEPVSDAEVRIVALGKRRWRGSQDNSPCWILLPGIIWFRLRATLRPGSGTVRCSPRGDGHHPPRTRSTFSIGRTGR